MANRIRLGPRQAEVFWHILHGKSNASIATAMGVSVQTVKSHVKILFRKLNVTSRSEIIARYSLKNLSEPLVDFGSLSGEALETARLVARGKIDQAIATELGLSINGVRARVSTWLLKPFGFSSRYSFAVAFLAWEHARQK